MSTIPKNTRRQGSSISPIGRQSCKFRGIPSAATFDCLGRETNGVQLSTNGCRELPFLAVIYQESDVRANSLPNFSVELGCTVVQSCVKRQHLVTFSAKPRPDLLS
jgi:hypothetical protein